MTVPSHPGAGALDAVAASLAGGGAPLAVAVVPGRGLGLATGDRVWALPSPDPASLAARLEADSSPRWVWWRARTTALPLLRAGARLGTCWDLAAVSQLLHGGGRQDPAAVWAHAAGLPAPPRRDEPDEPTLLTLLDREQVDGDEPVGPDGQLSAAWAGEPWARGSDGEPRDPGAGAALGRAARWAALALRVHERQLRALAALPDPRAAGAPGPPLPLLTARAESTAALLAVELERTGLPLDLTTARRLVTAAAGPEPASPAQERLSRERRDAEVLRHLPSPIACDLRNPASTRAALAALGIDVPDTRSWRLARYRGSHPAVDALLAWRKAERIATTYGWGWLAANVAADGRLRGRWSASDGAAGRMTAQAGLHNLPAELRPAVAAEPGHVLVRADLGQVEPRVLAVVSADPALAEATLADDLYAPVAAQLRCDRPTAKIAVLAAMYGQTSGTAGAALRQLDAVYPRAMAYLRAAEAAGLQGRDLRTYGGRLIRLAPEPAASGGAHPGRGRFARNAVVQGAAAELFKVWAATARAGLRADPALGGGRIVLCLHDELLLHVPAAAAEAAVALLRSALAESAARWAGGAVRLVVDVSVVARWSDAKG